MPFEEGQSGNPEKVFKAGESGNPDGRPKGSRNRSTIARELLSAALKIPATSKNKQLIESLGLETEGEAEKLMTAVQIAKAIVSGDTRAYQAVLDSAHGAPKNQTEISAPGLEIRLPGKPDAT